MFRFAKTFQRRLLARCGGGSRALMEVIRGAGGEKHWQTPLKRRERPWPWQLLPLPRASAALLRNQDAQLARQLVALASNRTAPLRPRR